MDKEDLLYILNFLAGCCMYIGVVLAFMEDGHVASYFLFFGGFILFLFSLSILQSLCKSLGKGKFEEVFEKCEAVYGMLCVFFIYVTFIGSLVYTLKFSGLKFLFSSFIGSINATAVPWCLMTALKGIGLFNCSRS